MPRPAPGHRRSQGTKKNHHCFVINNRGEVTAQDHLSPWISHIHADKIGRKNAFLFVLSPAPRPPFPPGHLSHPLASEPNI